MKKWKLLGLAGLASVAATGVVVIRAERRRQALTPDEVRQRLRQRYEAAGSGPAMPAVVDATTGAMPNGQGRR